MLGPGRSRKESVRLSLWALARDRCIRLSSIGGPESPPFPGRGSVSGECGTRKRKAERQAWDRIGFVVMRLPPAGPSEPKSVAAGVQWLHRRPARRGGLMDVVEFRRLTARVIATRNLNRAPFSRSLTWLRGSHPEVDGANQRQLTPVESRQRVATRRSRQLETFLGPETP
jgi:hypothetical protein